MRNILLFVHTSKAHLFDFPTTQNPLYLVHYRVWEERQQVATKALWRMHLIFCTGSKDHLQAALKLIIKRVLKLCGLWDYAQKLRKIKSDSANR